MTLQKPEDLIILLRKVERLVITATAQHRESVDNYFALARRVINNFPFEYPHIKFNILMSLLEVQTLYHKKIREELNNAH